MKVVWGALLNVPSTVAMLPVIEAEVRIGKFWKLFGPESSSQESLVVGPFVGSVAFARLLRSMPKPLFEKIEFREMRLRTGFPGPESPVTESSLVTEIPAPGIVMKPPWPSSIVTPVLKAIRRSAGSRIGTPDQIVRRAAGYDQSWKLIAKRLRSTNIRTDKISLHGIARHTQG